MITLTVTTTAYATTAAAQNVYAATVTDTPATSDSTHAITDADGEFIFDSDTFYLTDSEG